jgi:hypothetical protein
VQRRGWQADIRGQSARQVSFVCLRFSGSSPFLKKAAQKMHPKNTFLKNRRKVPQKYLERKRQKRVPFYKGITPFKIKSFL